MRGRPGPPPGWGRGRPPPRSLSMRGPPSPTPEPSCDRSSPTVSYPPAQAGEPWRLRGHRLDVDVGQRRRAVRLAQAVRGVARDEMAGADQRDLLAQLLGLLEV